MKQSTKRSVSASLGIFACEALTGEEASDGTPSSASIARAIRYYLNDKGSSVPGWSFPPFLRSRKGGQKVELQLSIDEHLWGSLEAESKRQGVPVQLMLEHAVLYFAADVNAGRVTERILEDLSDG